MKVLLIFGKNFECPAWLFIWFTTGFNQHEFYEKYRIRRIFPFFTQNSSGSYFLRLEKPSGVKENDIYKKKTTDEGYPLIYKDAVWNRWVTIRNTTQKSEY